jgi:hypothetical protein
MVILSLDFLESFPNAVDDSEGNERGEESRKNIGNRRGQAAR